MLSEWSEYVNGQRLRITYKKIVKSNWISFKFMVNKKTKIIINKQDDVFRNDKNNDIPYI